MATSVGAGVGSTIAVGPGASTNGLGAAPEGVSSERF
jgi:hypothetical protein